MVDPPDDSGGGQGGSGGDPEVAVATAAVHGRMLVELLRSSHLSGPGDVAPLVAAAARHLGARDVALYVTDHAQLQLVPLPVAGEERDAVPIESTLAGWAFRRVEVRTTEDPDGVRFWVPMLDGTDRLGVLGLVLDTPAAHDPATGTALGALATLAAELVATRGRLGDTIHRHSRLMRMSLPAEVQWQLLPPLTFAEPRVVITAALEPAYEVGGDAFDYAVDDDVARFGIFDAMGHGLVASLLSVTAVSAYRNARRAGLGLVAAALAADSAVVEAFGPERFVTGILAELQLDTGRLRLVVAGHHDPLLIRDGRVVKHLSGARSLPFGLGQSEIEVVEEQLQPGDRLLLHTDGVVEARDLGGGFFGLDRLVDFLQRESSSGTPAPEVMRRLIHAVLQHQESRLQDDATLVLVEWRRDEHLRLLPGRG